MKFDTLATARVFAEILRVSPDEDVDFALLFQFPKIISRIPSNFQKEILRIQAKEFLARHRQVLSKAAIKLLEQITTLP